MRIPRVPPRTLLASALIAAALALAACGDDDDETTEPADGAAAPPAETEADTPAEAGGGDEEGGAGGNSPAPSGDAVRSEKVEIVEFTYEPDPVTIEAGGKVTWINRDAAPHTATADDGSFDTGTLEEGKLKAETFKQPGEFPYFCEIHPSMRGTVEVVASG